MSMMSLKLGHHMLVAHDGLHHIRLLGLGARSRMGWGSYVGWIHARREPSNLHRYGLDLSPVGAVAQNKLDASLGSCQHQPLGIRWREQQGNHVDGLRFPLRIGLNVLSCRQYLNILQNNLGCLLYTSPSPRDGL